MAMRYLTYFIIGVFLSLVAFSGFFLEQKQRILPNGAVVSAHPLATQAGEEILARGGNAFDAAVAVSAMLSVVEPFGSGIGGGGFWMMYEAETDTHTMLDAREVAPEHAYRDMYLDAQGNVIPKASTDGPLAAGIPGIPAILDVVSEHYGTLFLAQSLEPAIKTASEGFPVDERYVQGASYKVDLLRRYPETASIFLDNGQVPAPGWHLVQKDLSETLTKIANQGAAGFYEGDIAQKMVTDVTAHGGIWTLDDLIGYRIIRRDPIVGTYQGAKVVAPNLPSSGGIVLMNSLNILSGFDLKQMNSATRKHVIVEAMRRAYLERAEQMGDLDFVEVDIDHLTGQKFADLQRETLRLDQATSSQSLKDFSNIDPTEKGTETTHFAVVDRHGNRVAVTQSLNFWFGSGFVPKGTGVILNNQMDDFSIKAGVENGYQLIGSDANAIQPTKRMLSSMTPTFLETKDGVAILGTPGGSRIISMVLLATLNWMDGMGADDIVAAPRFHHQYHPDEIVYEDGAFSTQELKKLLDMGHRLKKSNRKYGNMQVILWDKKRDKITMASDPRGKPQSSARVY